MSMIGFSVCLESVKIRHVTANILDQRLGLGEIREIACAPKDAKDVISDICLIDFTISKFSDFGLLDSFVR